MTTFVTFSFSPWPGALGSSNHAAKDYCVQGLTDWLPCSRVFCYFFLFQLSFVVNEMCLPNFANGHFLISDPFDQRDTLVQIKFD